MEFKELPSRSINGGIGYTFKAANGYGASIVKHSFSYGGSIGLWELAVLDSDGSICYDTAITNDVLGYLTDEEVNETLLKIAELKPIGDSAETGAKIAETHDEAVARYKDHPENETTEERAKRINRFRAGY